jgi:hypothetical protein
MPAPICEIASNTWKSCSLTEARATLWAMSTFHPHEAAEMKVMQATSVACAVKTNTDLLLVQLLKADRTSLEFFTARSRLITIVLSFIDRQ